VSGLFVRPIDMPLASMEYVAEVPIILTRCVAR
jgi:hypothetical protein